MLQLPNGGLQLFPPLVWKFTYDFDLEVLYPKISDILNRVKINSNLEKGNAISTVSLDAKYQPHTWIELTDFQCWLGEKINNIRKEYDFIENHSEVNQSWINRHLYSGETLEHSHSHSTFVASCYLKCPPGSGNIEFKDPLEYHKHNFPVIPELSFYKEVPCETNSVVIFPGWLRHKTQPNLTDQERIVMTLNIK